MQAFQVFLERMAQLVGGYIPNLMAALAILIVGWLVALILSAIVRGARCIPGFYFWDIYLGNNPQEEAAMKRLLRADRLIACWPGELHQVGQRAAGLPGGGGVVAVRLIEATGTWSPPSDHVPFFCYLQSAIYLLFLSPLAFSHDA
jgi:hypothetical protein